MNDFLLKDNEILIFTDFNNTLVDFENEYNFLANRFDEDKAPQVAHIKSNLTRCLNDFEQKTGLTPVICIVTNASAFAVDSNNYSGIFGDLQKTFFDHSRLSKVQAQEVYNQSCERFFRFLLYRENDFFFNINPLADSLSDMFVPYEFSENAKNIRFIPQFKKKESVQRMLSLVDPNRDRVQRAIFAGDSIKDDYPMKLAETAYGTSKFFIRPGKSKIMKPSLIYEFCTAKGFEFSSVHPKTGKKLKNLDLNNIQFLNDADRAAYENFADGDVIYLTSKNSRGLVEGLYQVMDAILSENAPKQLGEE